MISIIQDITVEVSKPNFFQAIVAKQYDSNSRFLKATLVQDSEKINISKTSTVTINAKRNDGTEKSFSGEVNDNGTVTVPLTYWMLELNGTLECDISIFGADESKLTSTKFIVEVERASCSGGDVTDSDKCDIIILQGQNIVGSVNGKTGTVELSASDLSISDYVVEQGASDIWTYRKWASGIAECWGEVTLGEFTDPDQPTLASIWRLSPQQEVAFPEGLFSATPYATGEVKPPQAICLTLRVSGVSRTQIYYRVQGAEADFPNTGARVTFMVKGRWK